MRVALAAHDKMLRSANVRLTRSGCRLAAGSASADPFAAPRPFDAGSAHQGVGVVKAMEQVMTDARAVIRNARRALGATTIESPWFRWRLGLLDFDQGLVGPIRSVEDGFELCGR